ncbi:MAG: alanyl-tRNA editing protein [Agathobacter sp.]|nr:alanyl-tRNA editing protein [Agathobacter sp.]
MATIKLYDLDSYQKMCQGKVLSCVPVEGDHCKYEVILDQTCFFPEEGGQTSDKGTLGEVRVLDVQLRGEELVHITDGVLETGSSVEGRIKWEERFSKMQQHSGEHIFSGLVDRYYGFQNVGFHLSDQIVTMDFDGPLTPEQVEDLEWKVNQVIAENVAIRGYYPSKEALKELSYRSKKEIDGDIRIVEIEGYDMCACCAPHVARTGEIGGFRIQTVQNYKGGVRISFLCGLRALEEDRKKGKVLAQLTGILTTSQEQLADSVGKLKANNQNLQYQLNVARQALLEEKVAHIPEEQQDVILFEDALEAVVARNVVNGLVEKHKGICGIFMTGDNGEYKFILGSASRDCRPIAAGLKEKLNARGGGSAAMIQGSVVATREAIEDCVLNRQ